LGTAFTEEQARLLKRWADKVILVFDSDKAGQEAAFKSILLCRKNGLQCFLTKQEKSDDNITISAEEWSKCKDPADILMNFGENVLNKQMKCIINDFDYLISRSKSLFNISLPMGKRSAIAFLFPYLEVLDSEIERNDCITSAAGAFGAERNAVQKDFVNRQNSLHKQRDVNNSNIKNIQMNDELFLLILVAVNSSLYPALRSSLEIREIFDPVAKELFVALEECFVNDEIGLEPLLNRIGSQDLRKFIEKRGTSPEFTEDKKTGRDPVRLFDDGIKLIKRKRLKARLGEIISEISREERNPNQQDDTLNELLIEKKSIDAEIRRLEGR